MQDSLEDYLKLSKNFMGADPLNISKGLIVTAQLKKECEARAMKIVEFSIEGKLRPEVFTRCLPFINQSHYQDIVEERAISKLCGYSLCGKHILDMPKKQYFISTKSNKVYDITERKNFCSNFCYKASSHLKKQVDNSPLWLRKLEGIPEYKLLHTSEGGSPGEYIDQGLVKPVDKIDFTSINAFAHASLDSLDQKPTKNNRTRGFKKSSQLKHIMQTIKENDVEIEEETTKRVEKVKVKSVKKDVHKRSCIVSLPSIEENEERLQNETESNKSEQMILKEAESLTNSIKSDPREQKPIRLDIRAIIKKAFDDWVTLETCIFIHGEPKVRRILDEKKLEDCFERLHVAELQTDQQMKYMEICRRLQLQEMANEKFDMAVIGGQKLRPLPDFKQLKQDTKEMKLKVRAFYQGEMYEGVDKNFPTRINNTDEEPPEVLPLVDAKSQNVLRRKIFLNSLSKAIQQLLQTLNAPYSAVISDVQALVKTFLLKADNITFKPFIWNYISIVLLNLLAIKDESLKEILENRSSRAYIDMLLEPVSSQADFISEVLSNVRNVDSFVEQYITKDSNIV